MHFKGKIVGVSRLIFTPHSFPYLAIYVTYAVVDPYVPCKLLTLKKLYFRPFRFLSFYDFCVYVAVVILATRLYCSEIWRPIYEPLKD